MDDRPVVAWGRWWIETRAPGLRASHVSWIPDPAPRRRFDPVFGPVGADKRVRDIAWYLDRWEGIDHDWDLAWGCASG